MRKEIRVRVVGVPECGYVVIGIRTLPLGEHTFRVAELNEAAKLDLCNLLISEQVELVRG